MSVPGGVQDQVMGLARALGQRGHRAVVIAPGKVADPSIESVNAGRWFRYRVNGSVAPIAPQPTAALRAIAAISSLRLDVLHLHEPMAPSITLPALMAHQAPVVGTFHAAGEHTPYPVFAPTLRLLARRLDARVAVSESARDLAAMHMPGRYEVLFNGIDLRPFDGPAPPRTARPTVLFLGRHDPRKGLDVLLQAARSLPRDVLLWVAGDGPATAELHQLHHGPNVRWLGRISDAEKVRRMRTAWAVCAPSLHGESFGIVLLEAMAAGTPLVASDLPGYRSLTDDGLAATLVPPGDAVALAVALRDVLDQPACAASRVQHGRQLAASYSIERLAECYEIIYRQVVALTRPASSDRRSTTSTAGAPRRR
jgi:phosphatidylinositol alpha-mannosyltransferase